MLSKMMAGMSAADRAALLRNLLQGSDLDAAARWDLLMVILEQCGNAEKAKLQADRHL